jgi:hypothetical protein
MISRGFRRFNTTSYPVSDRDTDYSKEGARGSHGATEGNNPGRLVIYEVVFSALSYKERGRSTADHIDVGGFIDDVESCQSSILE